jgi:hypothetical protein
MNRLADATPAQLGHRYGYWPMVCATKEQRLIALCRTLNLIKEEM